MYKAYQAQSDLMWPLRTLARMTAPLFLDNTFAFAGMAPNRRMAAVCKLIELSEVTHRRPDWNIASVMVDGHSVSVTEEVIMY